MEIKFVYYQEDNKFVGWLDEYPDYRTEGSSLSDLKEHLKDLFDDLSTGKIPYARKSGTLVVG